MRAHYYARSPENEVVGLTTVALIGLWTIACKTGRIAYPHSNQYFPNTPTLRRWATCYGGRNVETEAGRGMVALYFVLSDAVTGGADRLVSVAGVVPYLLETIDSGRQHIGI